MNLMVLVVYRHKLQHEGELTCLDATLPYKRLNRQKTNAGV